MDKRKLAKKEAKEKVFLKKIKIGSKDFIFNKYLTITLIIILFITSIIMIYNVLILEKNYYVTCNYDICYNTLYNSDWCNKNNQELICQKQFIYKGDVYGSKLSESYYTALKTFIITLILIPLLNYILYNRGVKIE